jgi:uncharacterized SAM-binding protein YcdF (DUF218 family)
MSWIKSTRLFLILLFLCIMVFLLWILFEAYGLRNPKVSSWSQAFRGDCALVLTGGQGRVRAGFDLLQRGDVRKLVISGVNPNVTLDEIFPQIDIYPGVQRFNVLIENHSRTTYGNVVHSLPILERLRCQRVILVTSQLHMARAKKLFEKNASSLDFEAYSVYSELDLKDILNEAMKTVFYNLWF